MPPLGDQELLVLPSRKGESEIIDLTELSDGEDDESRVIVQTLVKPTIKIKGKTTSRTGNAKGVST